MSFAEDDDRHPCPRCAERWTEGAACDACALEARWERQELTLAEVRHGLELLDPEGAIKACRDCGVPETEAEVRDTLCCACDEQRRYEEALERRYDASREGDR